MSVLTRFKDIISSNINALLDRCEDPEKMVDKYLLDALDDLAEVKQDTAVVMAEETRCKRLVEDAEAEVSKYETLAMRALKAGNEDDARTLIAHKQECEANVAAARRSYDLAAANADKMRQLHDKLTADIESLRSRRANIRATMAVAEAQSKINEMSGAGSALAGLEQMEERANRMLDEAMAGAELDADPLVELEKKYDGAGAASVEDELAAMKAKLAGGDR